MNPKLKTVSSLYEEDFALWIERTAQLLREHSFEEVDWENVIEEIESLFKSDRRALRSQIVRVLKHLLKLDYQPRTYPPTNWLTSIADGRTQIELIIEDSPSLKPYLAEVLSECYHKAVREASTETRLPIETFPSACPYTLNEVMNLPF